MNFIVYLSSFVGGAFKPYSKALAILLFPYSLPSFPCLSSFPSFWSFYASSVGCVQCSGPPLSIYSASELLAVYFLSLLSAWKFLITT